MKIVTAACLCLVALLAFSLPAQAASSDGDTPPLFTRTATSKAPALLSRTALQNVSTGGSGCDLCDSGSGKVENISFLYSGPDNTTVTFQVANPGGGILKTVTVDDGDTITLDASTIPGRSHLGNNVQIIIDGVNGSQPIQIWVNGSQSRTEKSGTAFHTSCSPGTPEVGDVIGSAASNPTYSFEVIGGGSQGNTNACPVAVTPSCPSVLDIDAQSTGAFVDGAGLFPGVTVSVSGAGTTGGNPRRAMIFDTNNPTAPDPDLGTPNQAFGGPGVGTGGASGPGANTTARGKAIIISTDNNQGTPNDHAGGGTITFTFDGLVDFDSIALLDVENTHWSITAKDAGGSTIKTVTPNAFGDNSYEIVAVNADDVKSLEVTLNNDSGAILDLFYCAIDLECAANDAPFLDFENETDPGEAPEGGDIIKFTAPFTNNASASSTATNIEVTATYDDAQFTYVSGSAMGGDSQDASTPGEIVFSINSLAAGATETLMFKLQVNASATGGTVVTSVTAASEADSDSSPDNFATAPAEDDACTAPFTNLPVELTAFEAQADGRAATLAWQTASETNNAGFEIQHRYLGEASKSNTFNALAFVEGHGTTEAAQNYSFRLDQLEPGRHVFRLKQIDYDGAFEYSPEIEVAIDLPESYLVSPVYPNPFNPQASFSFSVSRSQQVSVSVFNMLGQRVAVLFDGVLAEGTSRTVQIDGGSLQSGTYVVRVLGEAFVDTQTITLVK